MKCAKSAQNPFSEWESRAINDLVKRYRRGSPRLRQLYEEADLMQICLIHWFKKRGTYDAGAGASEKTYLTRVVERKLQGLYRKFSRDKHRLAHEALSLTMPISEDRELGDVTAGPAGDLDLRADLNSAIQALTPRQRMVLELRAGNTEATEIGKRLGIHRSTVHEEFNRIRKLFRDKGLKEYIE